MEGYSTKLDWRCGPDHEWWVELLKDGVRVAYMSLDEWGKLGATQQAIEDSIADGIVTLPREERERTIRGADFHAAATTSRHVLIAAARKTRCD